MSAPDWDLAACRGTDPEAFFPEAGYGRRNDWSEAKAVCKGCPIRDECLTWALETRQDFGMWGGMTEDERAALRVRRAPIPWRHGTEAGHKRHIRAGEKPCGACVEGKATAQRKRRNDTRRSA